MSFGFSAGDFIAVGTLIKDIVTALQGTSAEYRDLLCELDILQKAIDHLDKLQATTSHFRTADSIRYAALSCRRPLEEFLGKLQKYEISLGHRPSSSRATRTYDKLKFALHHKSDIQRLQVYLSVHVATINMLLAEYGLDRMELAAEKREEDQRELNMQLAQHTGLLNRIHDGMLSQAITALKTLTAMDQVCKVISGEIQATWKGLESMVTRLCISTQQIYAVVLEIRTSINNTPDTRWSHFQDPIIVEDALGRKFPFPSEFSFSDLEAMLRHRFREGPGFREVSTGEFEILEGRNRTKVPSETTLLRPGSSLTMAIIISRSLWRWKNMCQMPNCRSKLLKDTARGGQECCECHTWFGESDKRLVVVGIPAMQSCSLATGSIALASDLNPDLSIHSRRDSLLDRWQLADYQRTRFRNVKLANGVGAKESVFRQIDELKRNVNEYDELMQSSSTSSHPFQTQSLGLSIDSRQLLIQYLEYMMGSVRLIERSTSIVSRKQFNLLIDDFTKFLAAGSEIRFRTSELRQQYHTSLLGY